MASKCKFGKMWSWTNDLKSPTAIDQKHIDIVYRLDATRCAPGSCKTNCAANPFCLNGLGEKKLTSSLQKEQSMTPEKGSFLREENEYAGLINLGATCYINTYLQVWYNNVIFREYILQAPFEQINSSSNNDEDVIDVSLSETIPPFKIKDVSCLGKCLQIVFALMKESKRKSIDPNFFIKALGLDENMQQDAQEFSQLFLTTLQSSLVSSNFVDKSFSTNNMISTFTKSLSPSNVINDLFQGECSYITECKSCSFASARNSTFIELSLSLQNCSKILDCLKDLLKPEIMDGDNQYYCGSCEQKRTANRTMKLSSFPPVLNLQLLRFVYDRASGYKKKLSTKIKFSEVLDLSKFKHGNDTQPKPIYHLGAVLMHVGKTAYSGHYMAQIKNFQNNEWFNFNDEVITKLKKKQQLGSIEDETDSKSSQPEDLTQTDQNCGKTFSTANAYLLVYYRADFLLQTPPESTIAKLSNQNRIINKDNLILEEWFTKLRTAKASKQESITSERENITTIYNKLWVNNNSKEVPKLKAKRSRTVEQEVTPPVTDDVRTIQRGLRDPIPALSFYSSSKPSKPVEEVKVEVANPDDTEQLYFISTNYLKRLLSMQTKLSEIKNLGNPAKANCLCQHKRLNPMAVNKFKLVRKEGLNFIMDRFDLKLSDLCVFEANSMSVTKCKQCVINCYEYLRMKENIKNDAKIFRAMLKETLSDESNGSGDDVVIIEDREVNLHLQNYDNKENCTQKTLYWVGKESLRLWSSFLLKKYEDQLPGSKTGDFTEKEIDDMDQDNQIDKSPEVKLDQKNPFEYLNEKSNNIDDSNGAATKQSHIRAADQQSSQETNTVTLNYFNEDILCPHRALSTTHNKRLISSALWNQFIEPYFISRDQNLDNENVKVFTNSSHECKICQKHNEENASKKLEIKNQKEILSKLYANKSRPNLFSDFAVNTKFYLIPTEFIKIWRGIIKQSKFKNIQINNTSIICPHHKLAFNEFTMDSSIVTIITKEEWSVLASSFSFDQAVTVIKEIVNAEEDNIVKYSFKFEPEVCGICMEQNEINKYLFENKKIAIRQVDEETSTAVANEKSAVKDLVEMNKEANVLDDNEVTYLTSKRARLNEINEDSPGESITNLQRLTADRPSSVPISSNPSMLGSSLTRRSKRSRKCKGDIEINAGSFDTIKQLKVQIYGKISRMISEQHLFFQNIELENDKCLVDYRIHFTDVLHLKVDPIMPDDDTNSSHDYVHLPEIGFKGTNLISR